MTKLHIITYATHSSGLFEILKKSAKKNNIDLKIIGLGKKWNFYGKKFEIVLNYIKDNKLLDDDLVLFVDAFDVIILGNEEEILKKYNLLNDKVSDKNKKDLIFSYTREGFNMITQYFIPEVNSGLFMGKVKKINFLFNKIIKYHKDSKSEMKSSDFILDNYKEYYSMDKKMFYFIITILIRDYLYL